MCGFSGYFSINKKNKFINISQYHSLKHRGPDASSIIEVRHNMWLGFHRLSINDLSDKGMQPFNIGKIF